ncbi:hypothetical protein F4677DRAFT_421074 [Hypoxylon crocopeplum]|nr:hypothetical protein F4677DRAFT_421074 [Hypoxylon crocopeplum]
MPPLPIRCTSASSSSSAARLFVRLLRASSSTPIGSSSFILDVLVPPRTRAFHLATGRDSKEPVAFRHRNRNVRAQSSNANIAGTAAANGARRPFSATTSCRKTEVVYNPQKDEDGNDMFLEITPRAANKLSQIMTQDKNPHLALRITVQSGGCHGFQSILSLTSLPPSLPSASPSSQPSNPHPPETSSPPNPLSAEAEKTAAEVAPSTTTSATPSEPSVGEDDTIFAFVKDDNPDPSSGAETKTGTAPGIPKVILDGPSLELLKGSKVDYTMELIGSQFKIVDNPAASSSCGCGTSFDIKF